MTYNFKLKIPKNQIKAYASRYSYNNEDKMFDEIAPKIQKQKYLTKKDLMSICRWKSPRIVPRANENESKFVKEVTSIALTTKSERLSIEILMLLKGVSWPVASVILHFGKKNLYPILDYRALWTLGIEVSNVYTFDLWIVYVNYCRKISKVLKVDMRTLDRALWRYSKEHQK